MRTLPDAIVPILAPFAMLFTNPTWPSPALLGLFSWTTLAAHALQQPHPMTQRTAAWYDKPSPTFADAIAWCDATSGWHRKISHCRPATPTRRNSPSLCTIEWRTPSLTPLKMRKVQPGCWFGSGRQHWRYRLSQPGLSGPLSMV